MLVEEKLFASALALVRPLFESYLRGTWLLNAAAEAQIDDAGRDRFPGAGDMVGDLEKVGLSLTHVKQQWWKTLCSYTHTGYQQIGARLTSEGLGSNYAYGVAYEIEGPIRTPGGRVVHFVSIWQIDTGSDVPRFITMYPR